MAVGQCDYLFYTQLAVRWCDYLISTQLAVRWYDYLISTKLAAGWCDHMISAQLAAGWCDHCYKQIVEHQKKRLLPTQVTPRSFPKYITGCAWALMSQSDLKGVYNWTVNQV